MLKNYIITAWKVFLRKKCLTFINLFGICLTLTVIIVITSIMDNYLHPTGPEKTSDNFRVISNIRLSHDNGRIDLMAEPGYRFLADNVIRLQAPEIISLYTIAKDVASYNNDIKQSHLLRRTDVNYWKILDFELLSGRSFTQQEFNNGKFLAIINQKTKDKFFANQSALEQFIIVDDQRFQVIGVVANVSETESEAYSDIWVPYTTLPSTSYKQKLLSGWKAMLYHSNSQLMDELHTEYNHLLENNFISAKPELFNQAVSGAFGKLELMARYQFTIIDNYNSIIHKIILYITLLTLLFMLLPSINMINLNVCRIMERASEIGVRKAFGASASQLVMQFIVENILLTIAGGILSIIFSLIILQLIEHSQWIPYANFIFNLRVMTWSFVMMFVFGIISGLYPALKMSRLDPVAALKGDI